MAEVAPERERFTRSEEQGSNWLVGARDLENIAASTPEKTPRTAPSFALVFCEGYFVSCMVVLASIEGEK